MIKQFLVVILLVFHSSVLFAVAKNDVDTGQLPFDEDVRWSLQALPDRVDNLDWRSLDRWHLILNIFDTIVNYDVNQNLVSGVAGSWTVSEDRLQYNFFIQKGLKFSNGREIKADDVVFSLKRYLILQGNDNVLKLAVVGAKTLKKIDDAIDGVVVIDDYEVQIKLNFPLENIWSFLSQPHIGGVVARESVFPTTLAMHPPVISSGPYMIVYSSPTYYRLVANANYQWHQDDAPKTIGFYKHASTTEAVNWFFSGKTNLYAILDPFQKEGIDQLLKEQFIAYPFHRIGFLYLNSRNEYLKDKAVRNQIFKTMSSKYLKEINNPLLVWNNSFFQPGSLGFLTEEEVNNIGEFKKMNVPETLSVLLEKDISTDEISSLIKERMDAIGIKVEFNYLTKREISRRFSNGDFDMGMISVGFPLQDLSLGVYMYFVEKPSYLEDLTGAIGEIFYQYVQTSDQTEKSELLKDISTQILEDKVVIPIYHTGVRYIVLDELEINNPEKYRIDLHLATLKVKN